MEEKIRDLSWGKRLRLGWKLKGVTNVFLSHWMRNVQYFSAADEGAPGNSKKGRVWQRTSPIEKSSIILWNHLMLTWPHFCGNCDPHKMSVISHTHTNIYNTRFQLLWTICQHFLYFTFEFYKISRYFLVFTKINFSI